MNIFLIGLFDVGFYCDIFTHIYATLPPLTAIIIVIIVTVQCFVKKSSLTENCDLRVPISIDTILAHCKSLFRIIFKNIPKDCCQIWRYITRVK